MKYRVQMRDELKPAYEGLDAHLMQDPKRSGHRGFGFVTFAEDGVADRVSRRSHEICGQQVHGNKLFFISSYLIEA